jgi:hypothetical protein
MSIGGLVRNGRLAALRCQGLGAHAATWPGSVRARCLTFPRHAVQRVMLSFRSGWKAMVGAINEAARADFAASEPCAADMTRACLEELHATYKGWLSALNARGGEHEAVAREGPSLQSLTYELREMMR